MEKVVIQIDPNEFAKKLTDLQHETEQLRKHRAELLEKYEELRAKMQHVTMWAKEVSILIQSGTQGQIDSAICKLVSGVLYGKSST